MKSKEWDTAELSAGIARILTDGRMELPDDLAQLEDRFVDQIHQSYVHSLQPGLWCWFSFEFYIKIN